MKLEVWGCPRPAPGELAQPGEAGTRGARSGRAPSAARADPQRGLRAPAPAAAAAPGSGPPWPAGPRGERAAAGRHEVRTRRPAARRAHLLEGPRGSRLARRGASVVTASPGRRRSRVLLAAAASPPRGGRGASAGAPASATSLHFLFHRPPRRRGKERAKMKEWRRAH
ncbi:collagen alpha-1(I) chain-like [Onychomys torridus]|uniref:collagen alpha-1(I) chain-like n=1 Tax=Onychomys torridus TaxID=38674 RepID=UPI00167F41E0|nr:collagen alpha-1(I) chain-like [Onychomys torridus]